MFNDCVFGLKISLIAVIYICGTSYFWTVLQHSDLCILNIVQVLKFDTVVPSHDTYAVQYGDVNYGEKSGFDLKPNEYIVQVCRRAGECVDSLLFVTNLGKRHGPFGGQGGGQKAVNIVTSSPTDRPMLAYVKGCFCTERWINSRSNWFLRLHRTIRRLQFGFRLMPPAE